MDKFCRRSGIRFVVYKLLCRKCDTQMILEKYKNNVNEKKTVYNYINKHYKNNIKWLKTALELSGNKNNRAKKSNE